MAAVLAGYSVQFTTAMTLVAGLAKAHSARRLDEKLLGLSKSKLLIVDELGYLPLEPLVWLRPGQAREAARMLRDSVAVLEAANSTTFAVRVRKRLACALLMSGRPFQAWQELNTAYEIASRPSFWVFNCAVIHWARTSPVSGSLNSRKPSMPASSGPFGWKLRPTDSRRAPRRWTPC